MQFRCTIAVICGLIGSILTGCSGTTPAAIDPPEDVAALEQKKAEELRRLDGTWLLKSSVVAGDRGNYSLLSADNQEQVYRIRDGLMELSLDKAHWVKSAKLSLGAEPQSLLSTKVDAFGQERVIQLRYKLEGNSLITVLDNQYPDILPDSFELGSGVERQRQLNTYVRADH